MRAAAIALAERGWYVFPLRPKGKRPLLKQGFKIATADPARVAQFWQQYPQANIGLYPGPSKLLVIDIDGPKGEATAQRLGLLEHGTLEVRTGRKGGGRHRYHTHPGGKIGNLGLGNGVDVRADSGYVVVPPSVHPTGTLYEWLGDFPSIRALTEGERALFAGEHKESAITVKTGTGPIRKGGRNNAVMRYVGKLFARELGDREVLVLAHEFNRTTCEPPLGTTSRTTHGIGLAE